MSTQKTVSERLVDYVMGVKYSDLTPEAIAEAKRMILDVFGVAIVGSQASWSKMVLEVVLEMGGPEESTVIGGGKKVWCGNAVLANGMSLRHPEYCGHLWAKDTIHPHHVEENVPAALAMCEKLGLGGKDLILATVLGCEVNGRIGLVIKENVMGVHQTTSIFTVPLMVGKLMGLNRDQMVNALGISGSHGLTTQECHSGPHVSPVRSIHFGMGASHGIRSALLAQKGFTGPPAVIEGEWGFFKVLGIEGERNRARLPKLFEEREGFLITNYGYKLKVGDMSVQSPGDAILDIRREHKINPKEVKEIRVYLSNYGDTYSEPRKRPINKEDADHSGYYTVARGLIDGDLQFPDQYTDEKIFDPEVYEVIDKIKVYADPQLAAETRKLGPPANLSYVEVHMKDGSVYSKKITYVRGYGPFKSQKAVEDSYNLLASKYLKPKVVTTLRQTINNLENLDDVGELMDLVRTI